MMKNILIGGAWPYANGSLHIGHIAALLPGDVLARYHRAKGDRVYYVSGSDCHGTPVTIRARQEGRPPREISDRYHEEFVSVFAAFGFSYDLYTKTSSEQHKSFVLRCQGHFKYFLKFFMIAQKRSAYWRPLFCAIYSTSYSPITSMVIRCYQH
jgi:methionyl-tRNA synthetase